jgi:uncharacterized protein (UPF0335 family)
MSIDFITKKIPSLSSELERDTQELACINKNLTRKCEKVEKIDKEINKISKQINKIIPELKGRSLGCKIGNGFAATAAFLFVTPLSFIFGIFLSCVAPFGGSVRPDTQFFFDAPSDLMEDLFAKATNSKEAWEAKIDRLVHKKNGLESKRMKVFRDVTSLNEQLEVQLSKITGIEACKISGLFRQISSLRERVLHLNQEVKVDP